MLYYYLLTLAYCIYMSIRKWNRDVMGGGLGISPGLDSIMIVLMCWVLAPIDVALTMIRLYREAGEARIRQSDTTLDLSDLEKERDNIY